LIKLIVVLDRAKYELPVDHFALYLIQGFINI